MNGSVVWFNVEKGYGFIKPDDGSKDVFVHVSGISKSEKSGNLKKEQRVSFSTSDNEKGIIAVNVSVIEDKPQTTLKDKLM